MKPLHTTDIPLVEQNHYFIVVDDDKNNEQSVIVFAYDPDHARQIWAGHFGLEPFDNDITTIYQINKTPFTGLLGWGSNDCKDVT